MIKLTVRTIALLTTSAFFIGCAESHDDQSNEPPPPAKESKKENKQEKKAEEKKAETTNSNEKKIAQQEPKQETQSKAAPPQIVAPKETQPQQESQPEKPQEQTQTPPALEKPDEVEAPKPAAPEQAPQPAELKTLAGIIDAKDKVEKDLVTYLSTTDPVTLDDEIVLLTNEIFTVPEDMSLKVLQIQAALGRLKKNDLYTPEVKDRVVLLQNKVNDHAKTDENIEYFRNGVYLLVPGAVIGALSGLHFYGKIPAMTRGAGRGIGNGFRWTGSKLKSGYQSLTRENLTALAAWRAPSTETVLRNNLKELGLTPTQRSLISSLKKIEPSNLPSNLTFADTPKSTLRFAVLDHTPDAERRPLGINRMLAFRQSRIVRGGPFETTYVTEPVHAQAVGIMASRLSRRGPETADRRFARLMTFIDRAGVRIKPYFADFDVPTAVGTGLVTTTALTAVYLYGYENGRLVDLRGNLDLEALVNRNEP